MPETGRWPRRLMRPSFGDKVYRLRLVAAFRFRARRGGLLLTMR